MKKFLATLLALVLVAAVVFGVLFATGTLQFDSLLQSLGLQDGLTLLSDYKAPDGEGSLYDGNLPEDLIPDAESRYSFSADYYPYHAMLNGAEQVAYAQAYGNALELYGQFPLHTSIQEDSLKRVMTSLFADHPELFWLDNAYQYSYTSGGQVVAVTLKYNETASDITSAKAAFDNAARPVLQAAAQLGSAVEMEKYVHDYLLDNVSYVSDSKMNQSAYSALVYGQTVCAGYAKAFQYLMQQLGVPCYLCSGYAGEAHAWNIIRLDGEYYNVDVTWDDPLGNKQNKRYYTYYNLTDAQLGTDHTRQGLSTALPACNGTAYSYANAFGGSNDEQAVVGTTLQTPEAAGFSRTDAITSLEAYYAYCEEKLVALGQGTHTFTMLIENESLLNSIMQAADSNTASEKYLSGAASRLGFDGYSANISLQAQSLTDGYWMLTQQVQFTGQQVDTGGQQATSASQPPAVPPSQSSGTSAPQEPPAQPDSSAPPAADPGPTDEPEGEGESLAA